MAACKRLCIASVLFLMTLMPMHQALLAASSSNLLSIFGSSVAKGYGSSGQYSNVTIGGSYSNSYGALLTLYMATNNWVVTNQSIPGDTTTNVVNRFYSDEVPVHARAVLIGLSMGNEGLALSTNPQSIFDGFIHGITNLIAMSRSNNLLPIVGGGYPRNAYTTNQYGYLKRMDLLLNTLDVPIINFLGATDDGQGHWGKLSAPDIWHPNDAGFYEMFLAIVPSVFDALGAGKPTPHWSTSERFLRVLADPGQPAPLSFTPSSLVHSFAVSFRVRSGATGTVASVTLPNATVHPTVEIPSGNLVYVASSGQVVASGVAGNDGYWHDIVVTHEFVRTQTWFYVDGVLRGTAAEQLTPAGFVLGGAGSALSRPGSPASADYRDWFVHRSMLNAEEVQAQRQGALQQASLEVYAPLDDTEFVAGSTAANRAQSMSLARVNGANLRSELMNPIGYAGGSVNLTFSVPPGAQFELWRSATPAFSPYTVLLLTNAPANGVFFFVDTNPILPSGFYTIRQR